MEGGTAIRLAAPNPNDAAGRRLLREILAAAGLRPLIVLSRHDGGAVDNVETFVFHNGGAMLVALLRARHAGSSARDVSEDAGEVLVNLPGSYEIYDVRAGRRLGHAAQVAVMAGRVAPSVLALSPRPLPDPSISGPLSVSVGQSAEFRIEPSGVAVTELDILRIEAFNPAGNLVLPYSGNRLARGAVASFILPLAINDPIGLWTIRVRNVLNGATATTLLQVQP
jgi:hypothetical protein